MTLGQIESARCELQRTIDASKTIDARRMLGQFSTPGELARVIVRETRRYLEVGKELTMLEPSMGTGSFVSAGFRVLPRTLKKVLAYELDDDFYGAARNLWRECPCEIIHGDFTKIEPSRVADVVFANPPYVRHHAIPLTDKQRLQDDVARRVNVRVSGLAGLYCHFLLLSLEWMKPGAVGAWLIPSEWMSVNYGRAIREFFTARVELLRIHRFDAEDVRFSDALVSSCVVWFRNSVPSGRKVQFTFGTNMAKPARKKDCSIDDLRGALKWPPDEALKDDAEGLRIGDCFEIRRGIATGDNGFFVLGEESVREKGIPRRYLKPILPSPRHLKVDHVRADEEGVPTNAERRFLLDCTGRDIEELPLSVRTYLESGISTTATRNLCASRNVWYSQEQREPAPFLCSYMGRGGEGSAPVRFILNDSRAIATNSFLMLYPKGELARFLERDPSCSRDVWRMLLDISATDIVRAGRSYGGGLQKVEPKELARVPCRKISDWMSQSLSATGRMRDEPSAESLRITKGSL